MDKTCTVWLTGLPSSGKRTLSHALAASLRALGCEVEVIDSGRLRETPLGATLGFSRTDRDTNVRRHALAAHLLVRHGVMAIVSAVSPHRATREEVRRELADFVEVHVSTPRDACIRRDTRGNWARALRGEIKGFTGVDDPYEPPDSPEVDVDLERVDVPEAVDRIVTAMRSRGYLGPS